MSFDFPLSKSVKMLKTTTFLLLSFLQGILSIERDITFPIKAQAEECFYETALIGQILDIDYQVVDSSSDGNYHIDFKIERPDGRVVVMDTDKVENTQQVIFRKKLVSREIIFQKLIKNSSKR